MPTGLTLTANGYLSGYPILPGSYPVTFTALSGGLTGSIKATLDVLPTPTTSARADRYRLFSDGDFVVHRTPGEDSNLTWVVSRNGSECHSLPTRTTLNYRYHRNFDPGAYTVHLEAMVDGAYRVVSDTVAYTVGADAGAELLNHGLGRDQRFHGHLLHAGVLRGRWRSSIRDDGSGPGHA